MTKITMADQGSFAVVTASGTTYSVDTNALTLTREPGTVPNDVVAADPSVSMRRDGDTVKLVDVVICEIGSPAVFVVDLAVDGVAATARRTTVVRSIDRVA